MNEASTSSRATSLVLALGAAAMLALGGCSNVKETLGLNKKAPDEFSVVTKAPLIIPPNYNLRPPQPGAPRPSGLTPGTEARSAVFGTQKKQTGQPGSASSRAQQALADASRGDSPKSAGEIAMLSHAGADPAQSDIRRIIRQETTAITEKGESFADQLMFWRTNPAVEGTTIDAGKEAERLKKAAAEGKPASDTQVPVIRRKKQTLLEGLF